MESAFYVPGGGVCCLHIKNRSNLITATSSLCTAPTNKERVIFFVVSWLNFVGGDIEGVNAPRRMEGRWGGRPQGDEFFCMTPAEHRYVSRVAERERRATKSRHGCTQNINRWDEKKQIHIQSTFSTCTLILCVR